MKIVSGANSISWFVMGEAIFISIFDFIINLEQDGSVFILNNSTIY
jgi:hypothetical protein